MKIAIPILILVAATCLTTATILYFKTTITESLNITDDTLVSSIVTFITGILATIGVIATILTMNEQINLQRDQITELKREKSKKGFIEIKEWLNKIGTDSGTITSYSAQMNMIYKSSVKEAAKQGINETSLFKTDLNGDKLEFYKNAMKHSYDILDNLKKNPSMLEMLSSDAYDAFKKIQSNAEMIQQQISMKLNYNIRYANLKKGTFLPFSGYSASIRDKYQRIEYDIERIKRHAYALEDNLSYKEWLKDFEISQGKFNLVIHHKRYPRYSLTTTTEYSDENYRWNTKNIELEFLNEEFANDHERDENFEIGKRKIESFFNIRKYNVNNTIPINELNKISLEEWNHFKTTDQYTTWQEKHNQIK